MSTAYHNRQRMHAYNRVSKYGQAAILRRGDDSRACFVIEENYSPRDPSGASGQKLERMFLVAALVSNDSGELTELSPPPDNHEDVLVLTDPQDDSSEIELLITRPPGRLAPGGIVIYYELMCERP